MQEHRFVAFPASARLNESRAPAFDLNATPSLLLNVLHVGTALANNLGTQIEPGDWLEVNRNPLIGPFTLYTVSKFLSLGHQ
jgi:hypothetical protein